MNAHFQRLVQLLASLPGIGPRHAGRLVLALRERPDADLAELGTAIANLKKSVATCPECYALAENGGCTFCGDPRRTQNSLLIVERVTDLEAVERTGLHKGLYHVLGGAINPADGVTPSHLHIDALARRIRRLGAEYGAIEAILATNPTAAGDVTARYVQDALASIPDVRITRLARGLSSGAQLEYADEITLKHALEARH